ncbi:T9SS type A sorting domain-containing protein, partial [candidate division KSB1 bacterium]|nr:T9SS type A sorting domain-containing protein [candidate division KSB1 bacterium]
VGSGRPVGYGGETGIFAPWIAKSKDEGKTWEVFYPDLSGDNACDALVIHPDNPNVVYAGMEGAVLKTIDGGETWSKTALANTPVYFYGLALDSGEPNHIFAGGTIANPNTWALWESFDGGAKWQEIPAPNGVSENRGIRSIVADREQEGVIYIATFGHGVWKYQSSPTGVRNPPDNTLPQGFALSQNAPNPFARNKVHETIIRYSIPSSQHLKVEIFDLLGKHVATLVDRVQASGEYVARWNGKDVAGRIVPSGVYFYRLVAGGHTMATRKMILLHTK